MKSLIAGGGLALFGALLGFAGLSGDGCRRNYKMVLSPPDSPIVVRGGTLNFYANQGNSPRWQGQGPLFVAQNVPLKSIYLDGVIPNGSKSIDPVAQASPIVPANNWTITLELGTPSGNVLVCTQIVPNGQGQQECNKSPTGTLPSGAKGSVYVQGDPSNTLGLVVKDISRLGTSARLHYAVSSCQLSSGTLSGVVDLDPSCDKIQSISIQVGSTTTTYTCVDGACDIGIGGPLQ